MGCSDFVSKPQPPKKMNLPRILAGAKLPKLEKLIKIQADIEKKYAAHEAVIRSAWDYAEQRPTVYNDFVKTPTLEKFMRIVSLDLEQTPITQIAHGLREQIRALKDQEMAKNGSLLREAYAEMREVIAERRKTITLEDQELSERRGIDHVSEEALSRLDQMERALNDGSPHCETRFGVAWGALRSAATEHAKPRKPYYETGGVPDDEPAYNRG
jgi:hypothetical protein